MRGKVDSAWESLSVTFWCALFLFAIFIGCFLLHHDAVVISVRDYIKYSNKLRSYQGIDHQIPMVRYKLSAWVKKNREKRWLYGIFLYICRIKDKTLSYISC